MTTLMILATRYAGEIAENADKGWNWKGVTVGVFITAIIAAMFYQAAKVPRAYQERSDRWKQESEKRNEDLKRFQEKMKGKKLIVVIRTKDGRVTDYESNFIQSLIDLGCQVPMIPASEGNKIKDGTSDTDHGCTIITGIVQKQNAEMQSAHTVWIYSVDLRIWKRNSEGTQIMLQAILLSAYEMEWLTWKFVEEVVRLPD